MRSTELITRTVTVLPVIINKPYTKRDLDDYIKEHDDWKEETIYINDGKGKIYKVKTKDFKISYESHSRGLKDDERLAFVFGHLGMIFKKAEKGIVDTHTKEKESENKREPRMIEDLVSINNILAIIDLSDDFNNHVIELERLYNKNNKERISFAAWLNYYIKRDYSSVGFKDKAIAAIRKADELIGKNKIKWEGEDRENK